MLLMRSFLLVETSEQLLWTFCRRQYDATSGKRVVLAALKTNEAWLVKRLEIKFNYRYAALHLYVFMTCWWTRENYWMWPRFLKAWKSHVKSILADCGREYEWRLGLHSFKKRSVRFLSYCCSPENVTFHPWLNIRK